MSPGPPSSTAKPRKGTLNIANEDEFIYAMHEHDGKHLKLPSTHKDTIF